MAEEQNTTNLDDFSEGIPDDIPEMSADVGREPSFVDAQADAGNMPVGAVPPVEIKSQLDALNPVIQRMKFVSEQSGLPMDDPRVLRLTSEFGEKMNKQFTEARQQQLPGQTVDQSQAQPALPIQSASARNIQPQQTGPAPAGGPDFSRLDKAEAQMKLGVQNKLQGLGDETVQQSVEEQFGTITAGHERLSELDAQQKYKDELKDAEDYRDRMNSEITDISKKFIQGKIDPSRWYANRTTGQKIALGIGAFLNGFGGGTEVLTMMQNAINNDIKAQESDYKRKSGGIKNMYAMVKDVYGQDKDSAKILYALQLKNIQNQVNVMKSKAKEGTAMSKLGKLGGAIQIEYAKQLHAMGIDRAKVKADIQKDMKISGEDRQRGIKIVTAKQGFAELSRAFRKGVNTFSLVGDNEFTAGVTKFRMGLGFLMSGANVPEHEEKAFQSFVATVKDGRSIQLSKLRSMKKLFDKYEKIMTSTNMTELKEALGANKYSNKNFKGD